MTSQEDIPSSSRKMFNYPKHHWLMSVFDCESTVCCFFVSYMKTSITDDPEISTENTILDHYTVEPQHMLHFELRRFENWFFFSVLALTTLLSASTCRTNKCTPFLWGLSRGILGNVRNHYLKQNSAAEKKWIQQESTFQRFFSKLFIIYHRWMWYILLKSIKSLARIT